MALGIHKFDWCQFSMNYFTLLISFILSFLITSAASASCLVFNENERLSNFCLLESVKGKIIDKNTAALVTQKLKREGYFGGLKKSDWSTSFYPVFDYSNDINGGNPNKPLVLGGMVFDGDPELIRQEGVIATLNLRASNRSTLGSGKYFQTNVSGSYSFSPEHKNGFSNASINACYKNKITSQNSLDICASASNQKKEISESNNKSLSLALSNLSFNNDVGFSEGQIRVKRIGNDSYIQNQLAISLDTIHKQKFFSTLRLRKGEPVDSQIALNYGLDLSLSRIIKNRKYSLSIGQEYRDGGMLLGVDRSDLANTISLNAMINANTRIRVGYTSNNSTIDYYDQSYPSINLTYNW